MRRYVILLIGLTIYTCQLQAQSLYEDVLRLEKYVQDVGDVKRLDLLEVNQDKDYIRILKKYVPESARDTLNTNGSFHYYFKKVGNDFLSGYFDPGILHSSGIEKIPVERSIPASIGGLNITTFADGLSKFLVQRSKEEIAITFFDQFENFFKENPETEVLFPQTYTFLNEFESYEYSGMLNALRAAFINDLNYLPNSIPNLKGIERQKKEGKITPYSAFFESHKGKVLVAALDLIEPIRNGANPAEVLSLVADNPNLENIADSDSEFKNILAYVKTVNLLSQSFISHNSDETWVGYYELRNLIQDDDTFKIYLGLLYQQGTDIHFYTSSDTNMSFREILEPYASKIDDIRAFYQKMNSVIQDLNRTSNQLRTVIDGSRNVSAEDLSLYLNSFMKIYNEITFISPEIAKHEFENFLTYAKLSIRLYQDIQQKKYSAALIDAISLIETTGLFKSSGEVYINISEIRKYGLFISNVAEAQNSDEVAKAIETAVLPAGSSRIKRQTKRNVSLNAYLGLYGGKEYLRKDPLNEDKSQTSFGIFTPIGVAYSWGSKKCHHDSKRIFSGGSVFVSVIDIGAFASYRFQGDNVEELPEFELQNIIAPGLFLNLNFRNSPFTLSAGGQLGPQLRKIRVNGEGADNSTLETSAYRFQVGLSVDIPLLNFKTVSWN